LNKDEPKTKMQTNTPDSIREMCHGEAISKLETINKGMLEGSNSLKVELEKKWAFKEKREVIEDFFKSNVENMLENRKIRHDQERKEELKAITRKAVRELNNEMDPAEWKLIKLSNSKIISI
jgi:hypothetical protein